LYYPGGNETGAKPNLITCITEIFLSAGVSAGQGKILRSHARCLCCSEISRQVSLLVKGKY
jgi:hypothetical protein